MEDTSWTLLEESWERLAWARRRWQESVGMKQTGKAAAEVFGYRTAEGYTAYEREPGGSKHSVLSAEKAMEFGRKFKVNWSWILEGRGSPFDLGAPTLTPAQSRVVDMMSAMPPSEQDDIANIVEAALRLKAG